MGYFAIDPTGYFGDYTAQAVMNFQLANGLEVTGIVDEETYALLYSDDAIENPYVEEEEEKVTETTAVLESGPVQLPNTTNVAEYIIANEQNQTYADTASEVAVKTNTVTKKALSNSSSVIPAAEKAEAKRTAGVGLWFVLVAVILAGLAVTFFIRDRKSNTRYARYAAKKKKNSAKAAESVARW